MLVPTSLADAMGLQALEWALGNLDLKACKQCGGWFRIGPGTGHSSRRDYCSDKCRVAWHRATARAR